MAATQSSANISTSASAANIATVASAVPSITETTASTTTDSDVSTILPRNPIAAHIRFTTALLVLITQGQALVIAQMLLVSGGTVATFAQLLTAFMAFFSFEWIRIHSFALTRQKRAFFDEVNILETYQPRARTHGHLFQPDPPTPGPIVKIVDDTSLPSRSPSEQAAFNANRDAHYANMFEYALRVTKEAEEADRQALEAQKARLAKESVDNTANATDSSTTLVTAVPTGEPLLDESAVGTKIELPSAMTTPADDKSIRLGNVLSPKGMDSSTMPDVTRSSASASDTASDINSNANAPNVSGKKRRKKKTLL